MAQEFHISVTPLGEDKEKHLVRIERVAPGVPLAQEEVSWPVEDWLAQARQLMNDPLLGLLQGGTNFGGDFLPFQEGDNLVNPSSLNLVSLGQQLYHALFQERLRDSWMMAQAIAQNQHKVLRLRLGLRGTSLPRLPWEVLHAVDRPLATGTDIVFSRYELGTGLTIPFRKPPSRANQPLKILMVISGPSDQESLELLQEANHLKEELQSRFSHESPAIELTILSQPGREQLTQALEQGQYQVFHYAGHSNLGDAGGNVYLVSNKTGLTETLNGDDLAGLLVNNGVQLAVFNSCRGAYTATSDDPENPQERNLAEALVKRGIPAVIAMAERIPDEVSLSLTRLLYRNLNQGYPIDLSLSRARQGLISAYGSNQLYWALPVLYLHREFDGFLTNISESASNKETFFTLPEPLENSLDLESEETALASPATGLSNNFPDFEEPIDEDPINVDTDLDPDDLSDFIKNCLLENSSGLVSSNGNTEVIEPVSHPSKTSDASELESSVNNSNLQQPSSEELATPAEVTNLTKSPQETQPSDAKIWQQKLRGIPKLWLGLGATGIVASALFGFWLFENRQVQPSDLLNTDSSEQDIPQIPTSPDVNLSTTDTKIVTAIAIQELSQGNLAQGQEAVEALLNRGALPQAKAALETISQEQLDNPAVSFLKGRLAWASIQTGSQNYSVDDARRFWEQASEKQPNSSSYRNALGFAYYAEGDFGKANNAWLEARRLNKEAEKASDPSDNAAKVTKKAEYLNINAGLALGQWKSAQEESGDKRANLIDNSIKLRQIVMTGDPVNFQPEALSKHWLWSQQAIRDWQSLLAVSN
ncbi:MAG: CHAT domain-containing protein [Symploca sp. SIO2C1]|nr:CHAT domain-containing protein [Symploca sp. SIO2C1]